MAVPDSCGSSGNVDSAAGLLMGASGCDLDAAYLCVRMLARLESTTVELVAASIVANWMLSHPPIGAG